MHLRSKEDVQAMVVTRCLRLSRKKTAYNETSVNEIRRFEEEQK